MCPRSQLITSLFLLIESGTFLFIWHGMTYLQTQLSSSVADSELTSNAIIHSFISRGYDNLHCSG
jgi:hypothetical protein